MIADSAGLEAAQNNDQELSHPGRSMKVLIFAGGTDGDIHPQLGIALALKERGHRVVFFTTAPYLGAARRCGLETVALSSDREREDFDRATRGMGLLAKVRYARELIAERLTNWTELGAAELNEQSILLAPAGISIVGRLLQDRFGTPCVTTVFTPAYLFSVAQPPLIKIFGGYRRLPYPARKWLCHGIERWLIDPLFTLVLKRPAAALGVPLPQRVYTQWSHSSQAILGLFEPWFGQMPPDWPAQVRLTGFPLFSGPYPDTALDSGVRAFLDAGAPPVVFTPGTRVKKCRTFFESALEALRTSGRRGIFLSRAADQIPPLPDNVLHVDYLPLDLVLPKAAALVHHGGIGTTAQALAAGIPQLILPGHSDQFDNAWRVEQLGCGSRLKHRSGIAIAMALAELCDSPRVAEACQSIRQRMPKGVNASHAAAAVVEETFDTDQRLRRDGLAYPDKGPQASCIEASLSHYAVASARSEHKVPARAAAAEKQRHRYPRE